MRNNFCRATTGLLVSVRSAEEALVALAGGADVIDVKEPAHGPLGAAEPQIIAEVVRTVGGRAPVTAALGELLDFQLANCHVPNLVLPAPSPPPGRAGEGPIPLAADDLDVPPSQQLPAGISLAKLGVRGCHDINDWQRTWNNAASELRHRNANRIHLVAVIYADWQSAGAPPPTEVVRLAIESNSPALLMDTCDKSGGNLFDHLRTSEIESIIQQARAHGIATVLAGSLRGASFEHAIRQAPDLVAVRGAACNSGRNGTVELQRVRHLRQQLNCAGDRASATANR